MESINQNQPEATHPHPNKHGAQVAATRMVIGAAIGKALYDSIEGQLRP